MLPWHVGSFVALGPVPIGRKIAYFYVALLSNQLSSKYDRKRAAIIKTQYSAKRKKNANKTHYSMRYYPFETRFNRMGQLYGMSFSKRIEK
jgi:hypothetical protein